MTQCRCIVEPQELAICHRQSVARSTAGNTSESEGEYAPGKIYFRSHELAVLGGLICPTEWSNIIPSSGISWLALVKNSCSALYTNMFEHPD